MPSKSFINICSTKNVLKYSKDATVNTNFKNNEEVDDGDYSNIY